MNFKRYFRLSGDPRREAADELTSHIELKVEQLVGAGMSPAEARREALRQFGDRARIEREVRQLVQSREQRERRADWLDGARQDVRFACRQLLKAPGFALVAVLTLGLGIGANTAIFSVVRAVLLRPLPYESADRIVLLGETENPLRPDARETTSYPTYEEWRARARSFETIALFNGWGPTLTGLGIAERLNGSLVTSGVFEVFRIQPALGRPMLASDNVANGPAVVWISWSFWQTRFAGAADIIGQAITLNGRAHEVVGVLPRDFVSPGNELDTEVWSPTYHDERDGPTARYLNVIARLKAGVTLAEARSEMAGITRQLQQEQPAVYQGEYAAVVPFRELLIGSRTREPLLLLMLASVVVLLIACANTSNLLIARGAYRAREFAIRTALGTTRARLFRQLVTESAVLALLGGTFGVGLAAAGVPGLIRLAPVTIRAQHVALDSSVLGFALVSALGGALAFGLLPALRAGRTDVQFALREEGRGSTSARAQRVRNGLAVVQLSLALSLVLSAGLLVKSFARVLQVDPGIQPEQRLTLYLSLPAAKYTGEAMPRFYEMLVERLRATPGVLDAAMTSMVPFSGGWDRIVVDTGAAKLPGTELPEGDRYIVSPSYFRTMGIPVHRGRGFEPTDRDGPP
ncbi:MAG TPA: ABC transporter permease, partial [Longimicrobiales bacterium]|nr:ABC transporter permease [Longimicrobiales bacterium]